MKFKLELTERFYLYATVIGTTIAGLIVHNWWRKRCNSKIRRIQLYGLGFNAYGIDHPEHGLRDNQNIYFCPLCFTISFEPGICSLHVPNATFKKGRMHLMEYYSRRERELKSDLTPDSSDEE